MAAKRTTKLPGVVFREFVEQGFSGQWESSNSQVELPFDKKWCVPLRDTEGIFHSWSAEDSSFHTAHKTGAEEVRLGPLQIAVQSCP